MVEAEVEGKTTEKVVPRSKERLLDAEEIEAIVSQLQRPSARMHLEALAKKLRKEADALRRVEESHLKSEGKIEDNGADPADSTETAGNAEQKENQVLVLPEPIPVTAVPVVAQPARYSTIDRFAFDAGGYDSQFVTLYVSLDGVGNISRDLITCDFTSSSFDLIVRDLGGKSYRLFKDNLEKDIDADKSKILIKSDKIIVKLAKKKQEYGGYEYWSKLTDSKKSKTKGGQKSKDDPQQSIMDLMKTMYEEGDDNMRKMIGETMMKQQRGELGGGMGLGKDLDE